jgi:two-component system sensor histidine kinase KdpD
MLDEVRRRQSRGADVAVAAYQVHDEPGQSLGGLDVIHATRELPQTRDLDVAAVLARNPEVACIDDLMGLDTDGRPRIESVPRLLEAGIVVLATLHLLSVRDAAGAIAGFLGEQPTEPLLGDEIFDLIDELEYVDITPQDLLSRIRMHTILTPAQLAIGMQRELRPAMLTMLRETALRVTADHADRKLSRYLPSTESPLEFRGRIVLCLPIEAHQEQRIRAVARYAAAQGAKLAVVTVRTRRLGDQEKGTLGSYASLAHQLGGEFVRLEGRNIGRTLVRYIRDVKATEVMLGRRRHSRRLPWDTTSEIIGGLSGVDVHILRSRQPQADQTITAS